MCVGGWGSLLVGENINIEFGCKAIIQEPGCTFNISISRTCLKGWIL